MTPTDCIDLGQVQNFAARDVNRIVGSIAKVLARKTPYINVLQGGTLPNVSDVVRSVVQEQAVMASSLTSPDFVDDALLCGTGAEQDEVGSTEYQYGLGSKRGMGPRVCVKGARTAFKDSYIRAQESLEKGVAKIINADIRSTLLNRSGVKFVARKGVDFDTLVTGDTQQIDTKFYQALPNAPMNFKTLFRLATMAREELLVDPFGTENGDFFICICGIDQNEVFRNDADVKEDLIALTTGSFKLGEKSIAGYRFEGYRDIAFGKDSQPLRFNTFGSDGKPILIEPEVGVNVTNGRGSRNSQAWRTARFEIGFLIGGNSFKRLVPERYAGEGTFKFAPQLSMGELEWVAQRDNCNNLFLDYGQHIYQISRAYKPERPHAVIPFIYERCRFDTGLGSCLSSSNGL